MKPIPVGKHLVGDDQPAFIIAEVGSNWVTLEDCFHSIRQAKLCGADAVKFQLYTHEALYGLPNPDSHHMPGSLPTSWLPLLKSECDRVDIEFMCSAFSPELLQAVNEFVNVHKLASAEITHLRMLERLRDFGKPVFVSTGASGEADITGALNVLRSAIPNYAYPGELLTRDLPIVLMYCVAAYPARVVDLTVIETLRRSFDCPVGYSDHSTDVLQIPQAAVLNWRACVIEKHVTFIDGMTPDSPHSLTADEFRLMVYACRICSLGDIRPTKEEEPMILRHNRRLIATSDILPGEEFVEGKNFGIYRSLKDDSKACHPFLAGHINGRESKTFIAKGEGISPADAQ